MLLKLMKLVGIMCLQEKAAKEAFDSGRVGAMGKLHLAFDSV